MQRALDLARRGEGLVEPNPMVGCVIVRGGRVVGEGFHRRFGGPHAEVFALRRAGARARGATVYVTLEPCSHFGKTPPCADALIAAGVRRVIAATRDPNPRVSGRGLKKLRAAGINVRVGLLKSEARQLIAPFAKLIRRRTPHVILKWAQSLDGRLATPRGDSKWITCEASRAAAHVIRARVDAVLVGIETVLADDPGLTARYVRPRRVATRVVLDSRLRTPPTCRLVRTARRAPVLIVTSTSRARDRAAVTRLSRAGCEVIGVPVRGGRLDLRRVLLELGRRSMTNVMVEGGPKVLGAFLSAGLADEARVFVSPKLLGGEGPHGPMGEFAVAAVCRAVSPRVERIEAIGEDLCYTLRFHGD